MSYSRMIQGRSQLSSRFRWKNDSAMCPPVSTDRAALSPAWIVGLVLVTLAAAFLRLAQASESLWLDELHTAWAAMGPASEVGIRARIGNQSPLHAYMVRGLVLTLGPHEMALRFPSLIAGVALVPLVAWATWQWTQDRVASLAAAALVSVDHYCLFYSQEARPYALVQLLGLVQVLCFWRLLGGGRGGWRVGLVATSILLFHLHYTSALLLVAELVAYGAYYAGRRGRLAYRPLQFAADVACSAVGWLPALAHVWEVACHRTNWAQMVPKPALRSLLIVFPLGVYLLVPLAGLVAARVCGWLLERRGAGDAEGGRGKSSAISGDPDAARGRGREPLACPPWLLLLCWFAVPLLGAWLLTRWDVARLFMARYLIVVAVVPMIASGMLLAAVPFRAWRAVLAVLVVAAAVQHAGLVPQWRRNGRFHADRSQDWRGAVDRVKSDSSRAAWPVLVRSGFLEADRLREDSSEFLRAYCLAPVTALYRLDERGRILIPLPTNDVGKLNPATLKEVAGHHGLWVMINGALRSRPAIERQLAASLRTVGLDARTETRETFGTILLLRMRVGPVSAALE